MASRNTPRPGRDVVTLADLSPRREIKGGGSRRVFGADPVDTHRRDGMAKGSGKKDLTPKSPTNVKGGGLTPNDNITLVRNNRRGAMKKPGKKDLPPKSPASVTGGGLASVNDNITIVKSPKPTPPKDLEPRKPIKGGYKVQ
jgi:hypothetical protein